MWPRAPRPLLLQGCRAVSAHPFLLPVRWPGSGVFVPWPPDTGLGQWQTAHTAPHSAYTSQVPCSALPMCYIFLTANPIICVPVVTLMVSICVSQRALRSREAE